MNTVENPMRELSQEEVASVSGGLLAKQYMPYDPGAPASEFGWIPTEQVTHTIHF